MFDQFLESLFFGSSSSCSEKNWRDIKVRPNFWSSYQNSTQLRSLSMWPLTSCLLLSTLVVGPLLITCDFSLSVDACRAAQSSCWFCEILGCHSGVVHILDLPGIWRCVTTPTVPDVSEDRNALIFQGLQEGCLCPFFNIDSVPYLLFSFVQTFLQDTLAKGLFYLMSFLEHCCLSQKLFYLAC